jgi:acylphosphatase
MILRVILTVKGEVQRVGYRDAVERIARELKLTGCVENIEPYDVKIVCEGEKDAVEAFIRQINIKDDRIYVENIDVRYEEPTNEFTFFKIIRGDMVEELGERFDRANYDLRALSEKQTETINILKENTGILKQNTNIHQENTGILKQNTNIHQENTGILTGFRDETNNNLTHLREDTNNNFTTLDSKYHVISEDMRSLRKDIHKLTEAMITIAQASLKSADQGQKGKG